MESALVLLFAGLLVFLAHLFVFLFEKTRVPDVVYLIVIGLVLGPVLHIVTPEDFGKVGGVFTSIALVIILFEGGLDLRIEQLGGSLRSTVTITLISMVLITAVVSILAHFWMGLPVLLSLFVGVVLATPAPTVIFPVVRQLSLSPKAYTTLMLESPLGEALGIVLSLAILNAVRFESFQVGHLIGNLFSSLGFALLIGAIGGLAWSLLLNRIRQLRYAIFTTPAFLLVLFGVTEFLGFSGPVSALTFGITIGNAGEREFPWLAKRYNLTPLVHNDVEKAFFGEIVFLIKTFFFVYLGLSIRFADTVTLMIALGLTAAILLTRFAAVGVGVPKSVISWRDAAVMGSLIPKGTAAAVLASLPLQLGLEGGLIIQDTIYVVVVTSILVTAGFIFLLERNAVSWMFRFLFGRFSGGVDQEARSTASDGGSRNGRNGS